MIKRLYLLRHGETELNLKGVIQGSRNDSPLTPLGISQTMKAKEYIVKHDIKFDSVYSSNLQRSITTATLITDRQPIIVEDLKEVDFGDLTGENRELCLEYKDGYKFVSGESYTEAEERFETALRKILQNKQDKSILCVSHGLCMKLLYCKVTGEGIETKVLPNLGIMVFDYDGRNFKFIENIDTQN